MSNTVATTALLREAPSKAPPGCAIAYPGYEVLLADQPALSLTSCTTLEKSKPPRPACLFIAYQRVLCIYHAAGCAALISPGVRQDSFRPPL